jgi:multidrug efflux pump subunit AcrA (membrane-fusion protein)
MRKTIVIGAIALVVIGALVWTAQRFGVGKENKESGAIAQVQMANVEKKSITEKITVYGSVIAQPGKTHSVSVAFETRVQHILVAPGQFVREDDPLTEIEPSPAAQLQYQQAKRPAMRQHSSARYNAPAREATIASTRTWPVSSPKSTCRTDRLFPPAGRWLRSSPRTKSK